MLKRTGFLINIVFILISLYFMYLGFRNTFTTLRSNSGYIAFIDVGNSDSVYITVGDDSLLLDGGPDKSSSVYFSYFNLLKNCRFNSVVLTHPHADHLTGLTYLLKICNFKNFYFSSIDYSSKLVSDFNNFLSSISNEHKNINIKKLNKDESFKMGDLTFYVLWPPENFSNENINNESLILLLDYNNFEVLFLADLEYVFQENLLNDPILQLIDFPLEIIKVPHQGSKDSLNKKLVNHLSPTFAIFSVGPNSYGHPSTEVIDFYESIGSRVLRTDIYGTIVLQLPKSLSPQ